MGLIRHDGYRRRRRRGLGGLAAVICAERPWGVPDWLQVQVGEREGQIAPVVFQRARALYLNKVSEGAVNDPCYFAMVLEHTSTDLHHWAEAVVDAPSIP